MKFQDVNWTKLGWRTAALAGWSAVIVGAAGVESAPKLAVVDAGRVTTDSKRVQSRMSQASAAVQPLNEQLKAKSKALEDASEAYSAQRTAATDAQNSAQAEKLRKMREEIEELNFELNRAAKRAQADTVMPMRDEISAAVQKVAQTKGYTVVLNKDQLFYFDPKSDITQEVIAAVDAAAPASSGKSDSGKSDKKK